MTMYEASSGVFDFSRFTPKYIVIAAKVYSAIFQFVKKHELFN